MPIGYSAASRPRCLRRRLRRGRSCPPIQRSGRLDARRRPLRIDQADSLGGVVLGEKLIQGDAKVVRIAEVTLAVREGKPLCLHHDVDGLGREISESWYVEALNQAQLLK